MKKISLLLILVMLFALLAGCTTKDGISDPDSSNQLPDKGGEGSSNADDQTPGDSESNGENDNEVNTDPDNKPVDKPDEGSGNNGEGNESGDSAGGDVTVTPAVGTKVGDLMATVEITTLDGETISIEDYRGKIVVFNCWATWCGPCISELPDFNKVATEYKDDVVIIAAHISNGSANAQSYVDSNFPETDIIFAYDTVYNEAYFAAGGTQYVPHTAVLDKNGVIVYTGSGRMSESQLISIIESAK